MPNAHNNFVMRKTFAAFRFGVAAPLYTKTTLHKGFRIQRRYAHERSAMRNFVFLFLLSISFVAFASEINSGPTPETKEVPVELLSNLHFTSQLFIHESHQVMLDRVAQTHLFYQLIKTNDPKVTKAVLEANLKTMKADLITVIESDHATELQKRRAKNILDELIKEGVLQ